VAEFGKAGPTDQSNVTSAYDSYFHKMTNLEGLIKRGQAEKAKACAALFFSR
jgi:hypothetical protein